VKWFTSGLGVLVVAIGLGGVPGCGVDNEADATKASSDLKDPGAPAKTAEAIPVPKTMEDYKKNMALQNAATTGVPGAEKKAKKAAP
jgi:hypothetical protein